MSAKIMLVSSLKGGVGKTTTSYTLCAGAVSLGLRVVAIDLDPTRGLSNALSKAAPRIHTIADVVSGAVDLREALVDHPMGRPEDGGPSLLRLAAGSDKLNERAIPPALLRHVIAPILDDADIVLIDSPPYPPAFPGPVQVADIVVIPTPMTWLSFQGTALTVLVAEQLDVLDKLKGLCATNVRNPTPKVEKDILYGLQVNNLVFDTILYQSEAYVRATSGSPHMPDPKVVQDGRSLLKEALTREAPLVGWKRLANLARQQRRPARQPA